MKNLLPVLLLLLLLALAGCSLPAGERSPETQEAAVEAAEDEAEEGLAAIAGEDWDSPDDQALPEEEWEKTKTGLNPLQEEVYTEDPTGFEPAPLQPGDYTSEEIEAATNAVLAVFQQSFPGCVLTRLEYDSAYSAQQRPRWAEEYGTEAVLVLRSDFSVDQAGGGGSLTPGQSYQDWNWVLAKNADGLWEVRSWGPAE